MLFYFSFILVVLGVVVFAEGACGGGWGVGGFLFFSFFFSVSPLGRQVFPSAFLVKFFTWLNFRH